MTAWLAKLKNKDGRKNNNNNDLIEGKKYSKFGIKCKDILLEELIRISSQKTIIIGVTYDISINRKRTRGV